MFIFDLKGETGLLQLCWGSTAESQVRVHGRLEELPLAWIVNSNLQVERSLRRPCSGLLCLWLLQEDLEVAFGPWFELDDIVLLMIDDVHVCNVEITGAELSHELGSVEAVRIVNPAAFLVEYRRLKSTICEVPLSHSRVTALVVALSGEEGMLKLGVVDGRAGLR